MDFALHDLCLFFCAINWNADVILCSRANKKKILEFLIDAWANDRRAEWSIWMVYSKVEMPHHYLNSVIDESSFQGGRGKVLSLKKLTDDVIISNLQFACFIYYYFFPIKMLLFLICRLELRIFRPPHNTSSYEHQ